MENIANLVDATPVVFLKVDAKCVSVDNSVDIVCKADPACKSSDEIDDMFQAFIDILSREVQRGTYELATLTLEHEINGQWQVFTRVVITSPDGKNVRVNKKYFDAWRNKLLGCIVDTEVAKTYKEN